jgi:hypothetical protein
MFSRNDSDLPPHHYLQQRPHAAQVGAFPEQAPADVAGGEAFVLFPPLSDRRSSTSALLAEVGVKWKWTLGCASNQASH